MWTKKIKNIIYRKNQNRTLIILLMINTEKIENDCQCRNQKNRGQMRFQKAIFRYPEYTDRKKEKDCHIQFFSAVPYDRQNHCSHADGKDEFPKFKLPEK